MKVRNLLLIAVTIVLAGLLLVVLFAPRPHTVTAKKPTPVTSLPSANQTLSNATITISNITTPNQLYVLLTDPPTVPQGTSSLTVSYDAVGVHVPGTGSKFLSQNITGTVNLLNLTDYAKTVAIFNFNNNVSVNQVSFNITSAQIAIGNTTYNVSMQNSRVVVNVTGQTNSSYGGVLVDLTPAILEVYTAQHGMFVMAPSARAIPINKNLINQEGMTGIGAMAPLEPPTKLQLDAARPNITITAATLSITGNRTDLAVTVKNNANSSVTLRHLTMSGYMKVPFSLATTAISVITKSAQVQQQLQQFNSTSLNTSTNTTLNTTNTISTNSTTSPFNITKLNITLPPGVSFPSCLHINTVNGNVVVFNSCNDTVLFNSSSVNLSRIVAENASKYLNNSVNTAPIQVPNITTGVTENIFRDMYMGSAGLKGYNLTGDQFQKMFENGSIFKRVGVNISAALANMSTDILESAVYQQSFHNQLNFMVSPNGTLVLPLQSIPIFVIGNSSATVPLPASGYSLAPGNTITLDYNSSVGFGICNPGLQIPGHLPFSSLCRNITMINNQPYNLAVTGDGGAYAAANVTAT